ncbi:hypothetical protein BH11ARM2_BH11ARM2_28940 [soil metagenome]
MAGPNAESKAVGSQKESLAKETSEDDALRLAFWTELFERCKGILPEFANKSVGTGPWAGARGPSRGLLYQMGVYVGYTVVQLRIDYGKGEEATNVAAFDRLFKQWDPIEVDFRHELRWDRLENHRVCCVTMRRDGAGFRTSRDKWPELQKLMIETMSRLQHALDPRLKSLDGI